MQFKVQAKANQVWEEAKRFGQVLSFRKIL